LKTIILVAIALLSTRAFSNTIPVYLEVLKHTVTANFEQSVRPDQINRVQNFFDDLKVPATVSESGAKTKKFMSKDKSIEIKCSEIKIPGHHFFSCYIKASRTASATYSPVVIENSGFVFSAKEDLATELNALLGGHPARCWDLEYGDNFIINLCPQYVTVRIYPKRKVE